MSIGKNKNPELRERMPDVLQLEWRKVKGFIFDRFANYERIKRQRPQWDLDGHLLWKVFRESHGDRKKFASSLVLQTNSPPRDGIEEYCRSRIHRPQRKR